MEFFLLLVLLLLAWYLNDKRQENHNPQVIDKPEVAYRPYTVEYDIECSGDDLAGELRNLSADTRLPSHSERADITGRIDEFLSEHERVSAKLSNWDVVSPGEADLILLLDQSGSMWDKIPTVAAHISSVAEKLENAGVKVQICGFTTAGWKGGRARKAWEAAGKPAYPGRLCDRLHVIYSDFETSTTPELFDPLLTSPCMFENLDGEALEWAATKLKKRASDQRGIIILSDGAPVDDSTLTENGLGFLWRHVQEVIGQLESDPTLRLGAIGIDHRVETLYQNAIDVSDRAQIGEAILNLVTQRFGWGV